ncbi:MAG: hypothetical protein RSE58_14130, partial [Clostridia bacterium]
ATKRQLAEERQQQAQEDFSDLPQETKPRLRPSYDDPNWQDGLEIDKQGKVKDNLQNLIRIIRCDTRLRGIAYNLLSSTID